MLRANTGSSTHASAKTAGREAAKAAKQGLQSVKMAFAYASCAYDLDAMLAGIADEMPGVPIIGNTSFTGVITPQGYVTGADGFVGMMAIEDAALEIGIAAVTKGSCAVEDGVAVAKKAMAAAGKTTAPTYFHMVAPPGEEEFYLKGITQVIGRVPFFGGSAADNSISGEWKLFTDKGSFADGVAVAFFYSEEAIINQYTGAYRETKDMGIITKVDNHRTLVEIDGQPALKKYAAWRAMDVASLRGSSLLAEAVLSPLGVKDRLGDLVAIRHPMNGNDDDSMAIGNQMAEGTAVIRMEATVDELIDSAGEQLRELKAKMPQVGAYHLVHCGGRRAGIGDRIDEVAAQLIEAAEGVPFITEFTFGEYGYVQDGCNTCGGLMLSFTGLHK